MHMSSAVSLVTRAVARNSSHLGKPPQRSVMTHAPHDHLTSSSGQSEGTLP
jgi:hypothetical protein